MFQFYNKIDEHMKQQAERKLVEAEKIKKLSDRVKVDCFMRVVLTILGHCPQNTKDLSQSWARSNCASSTLHSLCLLLCCHCYWQSRAFLIPIQEFVSQRVMTLNDDQKIVLEKLTKVSCMTDTEGVLKEITELQQKVSPKIWSLILE